MINHRFTIKSELGEGRSKVFLCSDFFFPGIDFAIKILPKDVSDEEEEKFRNEFFTLQKLSHPNIINSFEYGTIVNIEEEAELFGLEMESKFFTTEFFGGKMLSEYIRKLAPVKLTTLLEEIISTLYYLHQSNYIYNDLKPENILVEETAGTFSVKFIDFGLIIDRASVSTPQISGTIEYIAPERLEKKVFDHRIDLYSLGIILYLMIYGEFPFKGKEELEVFRDHINKDFKFPEVAGFERLIKLTKNLLKKDPDERIFSSLEIFRKLKIEVPQKRKKEWKPGNRFIGGSEISEYLPQYFSAESGEAIVINGDDGSGKSSILSRIYQQRNNTIFISRNMFRRGIEFWRYFIHKIIYLSGVYPKIDEALVQYLMNHQSTGISIDDAKAIVNKISRNVSFTLLLDDYNFYDDLAHEFLQQLVPILQVNKIKILITENNSKPKKSDSIFNKKEFELRPLSEIETGELIKKNFASFFPCEELEKLVLKYSDLLPGNIYNFYDYLILLETINFENIVPQIENFEDLPKLLTKSHDDVYALRLSKLTDSELRAIQILSTIVPEVDRKFLSLIEKEETITHLNSIQSLKTANIITENEGVIKFTSLGLKSFIYQNIPDKKEIHKRVAEFLENKTQFDNKREIARHYKEAGDFENGYRLLEQEIALSEKISLLSYKKILLEEVKDYPLNSTVKGEISFKYADVLFNLGEYKECLEYIEHNCLEVNDPQIKFSLLKLKGNCYVALGDYLRGKGILESILNLEISDTEKKGIIYRFGLRGI